MWGWTGPKMREWCSIHDWASLCQIKHDGTLQCCNLGWPQTILLSVALDNNPAGHRNLDTLFWPLMQMRIWVESKTAWRIGVGVIRRLFGNIILLMNQFRLRKDYFETVTKITSTLHYTKNHDFTATRQHNEGGVEIMWPRMTLEYSPNEFHQCQCPMVLCKDQGGCYARWNVVPTWVVNYSKWTRIGAL